MLSTQVSAHICIPGDPFGTSTDEHQDLKLRTSNSGMYASYNFCTVKAIRGLLARKSFVLHLFLVLAGIGREELLRT